MKSMGPLKSTTIAATCGKKPSFYVDLMAGIAMPIPFRFSPLECDSFELSFFSHFTNFPTESYARSMAQISTVKSIFPGQTITHEMLSKSFVEIKVYYDQAAYQLIEQNESLSLIDLIASLGGTLGKIPRKIRPSFLLEQSINFV